MYAEIHDDYLNFSTSYVSNNTKTAMYVLKKKNKNE